MLTLQKSLKNMHFQTKLKKSWFLIKTQTFHMPKLNDFLFILPNIIPGKNRYFAALSQFGLFGNQTTRPGAEMLTTRIPSSVDSKQQ